MGEILRNPEKIWTLIECIHRTHFDCYIIYATIMQISCLKCLKELNSGLWIQTIKKLVQNLFVFLYIFYFLNFMNKLKYLALIQL